MIGTIHITTTTATKIVHVVFHLNLSHQIIRTLGHDAPIQTKVLRSNHLLPPMDVVPSMPLNRLLDLGLGLTDFFRRFILERKVRGNRYYEQWLD